MNHTCEAALITCEDFRLHQKKDGRNYIAEFIKGLSVNCDLITRAGGIQDIVRPKEQAYSDCLLRDSGVSAKLHKAKIVYLVNHEDCGAYSETKLNSREEELEQHKQDLQFAREKLLQSFPGLDIKLYFAELEPKSEDTFNIKEIV